MAVVTQDAPRSVPVRHDASHGVPLGLLFAALLLLTAAEVGLYEVWRHTAAEGHPLMPKYALVLIILLVLTLPKAAIVLVWFMHIKFEKQLIVLLALVPLGTVVLAILPTLTDIKTLKSDGKAANLVSGVGHYTTEHGAAGGETPKPQTAGKAEEE